MATTVDTSLSSAQESLIAALKPKFLHSKDDEADFEYYADDEGVLHIVAPLLKGG